MKYTQEQLDGMSDTSKRLAFFCKSQGYSPSDDKDIARLYQNGKFSLDDYSYVMPIAFEHGIGTSFDGAFRKDWEATVIIHTNAYDCECVGPCYNTNPLIAIVDCFLMMNEDK